jgi:tetratricopeptide (TPR) repeat protein
VSIFGETGEHSSITQDPIRLFTDRYGVLRKVAAHINEDPPEQKIVFLVGLGGNGKSALLSYLRENCCFRLPAAEWREISTYSDELFAPSLSQSARATPTPVAWLDFGTRPSGENRPQELLPALFMLKRQLSEYKVATPRFDLASLTYYRKAGLDASARMAELFPASELGLAADIADVLITLPVLRTGLSIYEAVDRRLDDRFSRRRLQRRVPREESLRILAMPAEPTLADELPALFAADLRDALAPAGKHERIVLMFDTYEAFAGESVTDTLSNAAELSGPRWLRSLLGNLPLGAGVVPIVAGRTRPQWHSATSARIPLRYVDFLPVGPLGADFAETYLATAGVPAEARAALIQYASVEPSQVHPYLLGLCADLALARPGDELGVPVTPPRPELMVEKERLLASRLLAWTSEDMEDAIVAVSACRSFDLAVFSHLGAELGFPCRELDFRRLVAFSFASTATRLPGVEFDDAVRHAAFEIHRILRTTLAHVEPARTRAAHVALVRYYESEPATATSRAEAIYHRNQVDPRDGVQAWLAEADDALSLGRFDRCRTLVALLPDMVIESADEQRAVTYASARADLGLGRLDDVRHRLATLPTESAYALLLNADIAFVEGRFDESGRLAQQALAAAPDGVDRIPFLFRVAELDLFFGFHDESRRLCREAVELAATGKDQRRSVNEQTRFWSLSGTVAYFAGDLAAAKEDFARARAAQAAIPESDRDQAVAAGLQQEVALIAVAERHWDAAVEAQRAALSIRRTIADTRGTAHSLHGLGVALAGRGDFDPAEASFLEAEDLANRIGDELLLAKVARARGEAEILRGRYDPARALLEQATRDFDQIGIDYDSVHARLTSARLHEILDDWLPCVQNRDEARKIIERRRYFSLYGLFPEARPAGAGRFAGAFAELAAAAGPAVAQVVRRQATDLVAGSLDAAGPPELATAAVLIGAVTPIGTAERRRTAVDALIAATGLAADGGASEAAHTVATLAAWAAEGLGVAAVLGAGAGAHPQTSTEGALRRLVEDAVAPLGADPGAVAAFLSSLAGNQDAVAEPDPVWADLGRLRVGHYLDQTD